MRKEKYEDRQKIYSEIMDNPSMKNFYQLINRNRGQSKTSTTSIKKGPECDISDPKNQAKRFSQYMEDLFVPKDNSYENTFLELCTARTNAIDPIYENMDTELEPLSETEIFKPIGKLNTGKAMDAFGISAEHLKTNRSILSPIFTTIFNQIVATKQIPLFFKTGITIPVLKKLKDPTLVESYRGITVTPTITKLFEYVLLPRLTKNFIQADMQFGFTEGLSMLIAAFLVSECKSESKDVTLKPLYMIAVDSQTAFDVVSHIILLDKLYECGIHPKLWSIVKDLYKDMSSKIKWIGEINDKFPIQQGV
ncbi:unnamed protein product [Mytilus coruscus]|uniref:Uncharacterized protein n=1 Tax=Mytilus coruscus TaxID=42192 RepID=A0A6J8BZA9_MYTCO|nr:unnamed protein product [Mytilus coruscus]